MNEWILSLTLVVIGGAGCVGWWLFRSQLQINKENAGAVLTLSERLAALREALPLTYATQVQVNSHVERLEEAMIESRREGASRETRILEAVRAESELTRAQLSTNVSALTARIDSLVDSRR